VFMVRQVLNPFRAQGWLVGIVFTALITGVSGVARGALPDPIRFGVAIEAGDIRSAQVWLDEGLPPDFMADRIGTGLMIGAWGGDIPMMELFLSRGADINQTNSVGEQALMHAAWRGRIEAVRWLLDRGAHINRTGREWSALHYAVFAGHEAIAQLLMERGADINARSVNGSSVLMMAAREGREELARVLLERGADTTVTNDWGDNALAWAMRHQHVRIAKMVTTKEEFAAAARTPEMFGPPVRSVSAPAHIEALLNEMRVAQAEGGIPDELRRAYAAALGELQETPAIATQSPGRSDTPKALEITGKRGQPGQEKAQIIYDGGREASTVRKPPAPKPTKSNPKRKDPSSAK
jgi:uncharacterized protein